MIEINLADDIERGAGWFFSPVTCANLQERYEELFGDENMPDVEQIDNLLRVLDLNESLVY